MKKNGFDFVEVLFTVAVVILDARRILLTRARIVCVPTTNGAPELTVLPAQGGFH